MATKTKQLTPTQQKIAVGMVAALLLTVGSIWGLFIYANHKKSVNYDKQKLALEESLQISTFEEFNGNSKDETIQNILTNLDKNIATKKFENKRYRAGSHNNSGLGAINLLLPKFTINYPTKKLAILQEISNDQHISSDELATINTLLKQPNRRA